MKTTSALSRTDPRSWLFLIGILFTSLLAISHQSLWIDEANTGLFSMCPTLGAWWDTVTGCRGSDPQMPFFLFWVWIWEKIFGHGEYALRLAGWPFLAVGMIAFSWRKNAFAVVCGVSAFAWYYANEARPYSMQIGCALAMVGAMINMVKGQLDLRSKIFWQMILIISGVVLGMSYLLGMFWTAAYWSYALLCLPALREREVLKKTIWLWLGAFLLLIAIGCYYLWTIMAGARGTVVGTTDFRNIFFDFYELLGFGGLGPGRLDIRESGIATFMPYAPWLLLYGLFSAPILFVGLKCIFRQLGKKSASILFFLVIATAAFIFGVGVIKQFRVLGRHLAPMLPIFLWIFAEGVDHLWNSRRSIGKGIVIGWVALALCSCIEYRYAGRHSKDDYRDAAALANRELALGERVWWNAAMAGAECSQLPLTNDPAATNAAFLVIDPSAEALTGAPEPEVVCCSRSDVYDVDGNLAKLLARDGFQKSATFRDFVIWKKPGEK